jgi:hypothetical protein
VGQIDPGSSVAEKIRNPSGGNAAVITTAAGWSKISSLAEQIPSPTPPTQERIPVCSARARAISGRTAAAGAVV